MQAVDGPVQVPLTQGAVAIIDAADLSLVEMYSWHLAPKGYAVTTLRDERGRYTLQMHRLLLGLTREDPRQVDHINGDTQDNRRVNLRTATNAQNCQNQGKTRSYAGKPTSSHYRGVHQRREGAWEAYYYAPKPAGQRKVYLGLFATEDAAGEAARTARSAVMPYDTGRGAPS